MHTPNESKIKERNSVHLHHPSPILAAMHHLDRLDLGQEQLHFLLYHISAT
jgi:hypothetical protein